MARENQGLQIALIIFVMLTIILGVTTFIFFRQYEEATAAAKEAQAKAGEQRSANTKLVEESNQLKALMGFASTMRLEDAVAKHAEDMRKYAGNFNPDNQFYSPVLEYLYTTLQQKNVEVADARAEQQSTDELLKVRESQKDGQIQQFQQAVTQAGQDKQTVIAQAESERDRILQDQAKLQGQMDRSRKQAATELAGLEQKLTETSVRLSKLAQLNKQKSEKLEQVRSETFDTPDGEVRWVDQASGIVWIDLGRADALARQTSFSVYPADTSNLVQAGKKGSIEVLRIRGDHLAEARIIEDTLADPIMPGDKVHTPVWSPGEQKRFALAGFMDVDNDGRSDLAIVRNLISMNGGLVDAFIDQKGERTGEVTVNTRYLILGDPPDAKGQAQMIAGYTRMIEDAERHGVQKVPLADLLQQMGWKKSTQVVTFGRGANPNDFRAKPPEGVQRTSTGNVSEVFKPRRPPSGQRGAY